MYSHPSVTRTPEIIFANCWLPSSFLHVFSASLMSLNTMIKTVSRASKHPLDRLVLCFTVRKGALNGIRGTDMLPMLRRETVKSQQLISIFLQAIGCLGVFSGGTFLEIDQRLCWLLLCFLPSKYYVDQPWLCFAKI